MHSHPNARLMQKGHLHLVTQHPEHGRSLVDLAADHSISPAVPIDGWLAMRRQYGPSGGTTEF
jgi:hypothetical protein